MIGKTSVNTHCDLALLIMTIQEAFCGYKTIQADSEFPRVID